MRHPGEALSGRRSSSTSGTRTPWGTGTWSRSTCGTSERRSTGRSGVRRSRPCAASGTGWGRAEVSLRTRLTLGFAAAMAVVLAGLALFVDWRVEHDLTAGIDMELRSRGQVIVGAVRANASDLVGVEGSLIDPDEAFAQVLVPPDRILDSSSAVAGAPMLSAVVLRQVDGPTFMSTHVTERGPRPAARRAGSGRAGARRCGRGRDAERPERGVSRLQFALVVGGVVALALVSWAGWLLAGAALRPVEAMRREAAAISASEPGRRLPVKAGSSDELAQLADHVERHARPPPGVHEGGAAVPGPGQARAPHAATASDGARPGAGPGAVARGAPDRPGNASVETDRLVRLSEDLLVLGRAQDGRLPLDRRETDVGELLRRAGAAHAARADAEGASLPVDADGCSARVRPRPGPPGGGRPARQDAFRRGGRRDRAGRHRERRQPRAVGERRRTDSRRTCSTGTGGVPRTAPGSVFVSSAPSPTATAARSCSRTPRGAPGPSCRYRTETRSPLCRFRAGRTVAGMRRTGSAARRNGGTPARVASLLCAVVLVLVLGVATPGSSAPSAGDPGLPTGRRGKDGPPRRFRPPLTRATRATPCTPAP